jgi:hypothetical protein
MAIPSTREAFQEHCLRRLGKPVVDINVDEEQVQDRIDEAIHYYRDYHFDGTERVFYKHAVTLEDKANGYITLDDSFIGVISCFDVGMSLNTKNLFDARYQFALNDLYGMGGAMMGSIVPYYMMMQHVALLEEIFVGKKPIRYNRHVNKVHIDMDWDADVQVGHYIIIDCYKVLDPNVHTDMWKDRWLTTYATCLIKRQWGENLKKFEGMQMPGGLTFNGQKIWEEATEEQRRLEEEMITSYSLPVTDMIG